MENKPHVVDEQSWAKRQQHLTNASTGLTAAGAAALGTMLAGKTRAGKKILPKKAYQKLTSGKADDIRNTVALASMIGGVASGVHWSKKLRSDAEKPPLTPEQIAANLAVASKSDIEKAFGASLVRGLRPGRVYYRRGGIRRPPTRLVGVRFR